MFSQQQIPSDRRAKPPAGDPYLAPGEQGVPAGRGRRRAAALHRLGLAVDVHDAPEPVPAPARRQADAGRHGEGRPGRLGQVRQDPSLIRHAWGTWSQRRRRARTTRARARRAGGGRRRTGGAPGDPRNIGWLYVLPGLAFYVLFTLAPLLHTVYYSLFSWDGLTEKTWVGLANYGEALRDDVLRDSFVHSAVLIVYYAVLPVIIGLLLTAALTRTAIRGFRFFRTTLFLPQLIAGVVIAQAWTWIYAGEGPAQPRARARRARARSRGPGWATSRGRCPSIGAIGSWVTFGLCMVLFIAGVQKIPTSLYDAARVDGAGAVREFFAVTLPGLAQRDPRRLRADDDQRPAQLRHRLQHDGRRPGRARRIVPSMYMYQNAFLYNRVGYAAAIATVLAVAIFLLAAIVLRIGDRGERD